MKGSLFEALLKSGSSLLGNQSQYKYCPLQVLFSTNKGC